MTVNLQYVDVNFCLFFCPLIFLLLVKWNHLGWFCRWGIFWKFWPSSQISSTKFLGHKISNFLFQVFKSCSYILAKSFTKWLGAILIQFSFLLRDQLTAQSMLLLFHSTPSTHDIFFCCSYMPFWNVPEDFYLLYLVNRSIFNGRMFLSSLVRGDKKGRSQGFSECHLQAGKWNRGWMATVQQVMGATWHCIT